MEISTLEWAVTIAVTCAVLLFDVFVIARRPHEPTFRECAVALSVYIGAAVLFGAWIWAAHGHELGVQFYTGWLTEYSLSIDNLFVFIILMAALRVPREYQQEALLVGIILALVFRGIFIALGAAAINQFAWVFFLFGAFLIYTAIKLVMDYRKHEEESEEMPDNALMRLVKAGKTDQFAELVRRYQPALLRVARSRLGRADWAEEAVQEAFLSAFKSARTFDERFGFRTWLWTILLNQCTRVAKRERRQPPGNLPVAAEKEPQSPAPSPLDQLLARESSERLHALLSRLPEAQADALRLRFFGGLTFPEIAAAMRISEPGAKHRVKAGLFKLAEWLGSNVMFGERGASAP